jgi:hypothetical protein
MACRPVSHIANHAVLNIAAAEQGSASQPKAAGAAAQSSRTITPVLGPIDHVGYLAHDWERALEDLGQILGLSVTRRFERPEFSLIGGYLGSEPGSVEVFSFSDPELRDRRRGEPVRPRRSPPPRSTVPRRPA